MRTPKLEKENLRAVLHSKMIEGISWHFHVPKTFGTPIQITPVLQGVRTRTPGWELLVYTNTKNLTTLLEIEQAKLYFDHNRYEQNRLTF